MLPFFMISAPAPASHRPSSISQQPALPPTFGPGPCLDLNPLLSHYSALFRHSKMFCPLFSCKYKLFRQNTRGGIPCPADRLPWAPATPRYPRSGAAICLVPKHRYSATQRRFQLQSFHTSTHTFRHHGVGGGAPYLLTSMEQTPAGHVITDTRLPRCLHTRTANASRLPCGENF
jgi:hypothetical protein